MDDVERVIHCKTCGRPLATIPTRGPIRVHATPRRISRRRIDGTYMVGHFDRFENADITGKAYCKDCAQTQAREWNTRPAFQRGMAAAHRHEEK